LPLVSKRVQRWKEKSLRVHAKIKETILVRTKKSFKNKTPHRKNTLILTSKTPQASNRCRKVLGNEPYLVKDEPVKSGSNSDGEENVGEIPSIKQQKLQHRLKKEINNVLKLETHG